MLCNVKDWWGCNCSSTRPYPVVCLLFCMPCHRDVSYKYIQSVQNASFRKKAFQLSRGNKSTLVVVKWSVLNVMKKPAGIFIVQINLINHCCPLQFKGQHGGNRNEENYIWTFHIKENVTHSPNPTSENRHRSMCVAMAFAGFLHISVHGFHGNVSSPPLFRHDIPDPLQVGGVALLDG